MVCGSNGAKDRTGFTARFVSFRLRNRIKDNPGTRLNGGNTVFNIGGADYDAGVEIAVGGEVTHRAAVAAATASFGGGNQLHGAHFRRAGEIQHGPT